jgi:hypothetical protein
MPEASMNKNHLLSSGENKIRRAWQIAPMKTVTKAHLMDDPAHDHFGFRISVPNARHPFAAFGLG